MVVKTTFCLLYVISQTSLEGLQYLFARFIIGYVSTLDNSKRGCHLLLLTSKADEFHRFNA